jgi:hypothetical protein
LTDQAVVRSAGGDSRVAKFEHRLNELYNFHRHEIAVLCVLLLRGHGAHVLLRGSGGGALCAASPDTPGAAARESLAPPARH